MKNENLPREVQEELARSREWERGEMVEGRAGTVSVATLRKTFDAVCDDTDWKAPWAAYVPHQIVGLVIDAVEFFHADVPKATGIQPITGKVLMVGSGYQAW